jgi:hypothetical protein
MGSHWSCPRALVAAPTGMSVITRTPAVGRGAPGSVRALKSLAPGPDSLDAAPGGGVRSAVPGAGSGRLAARPGVESGARFDGDEGLADGAGSGARAGRGAGLGAGAGPGSGAGAALTVGAGSAAGDTGGGGAGGSACFGADAVARAGSGVLPSA